MDLDDRTDAHGDAVRLREQMILDAGQTLHGTGEPGCFGNWQPVFSASNADQTIAVSTSD
ncbi:hypothetical protein OAS86_04430 [Gammaproteobacteria bacterium]|nr:hypothetical protein [Gammaproteobacteria bacterium]